MFPPGGRRSISVHHSSVQPVVHSSLSAKPWIPQGDQPIHPAGIDLGYGQRPPLLGLLIPLSIVMAGIRSRERQKSVRE